MGIGRIGPGGPLDLSGAGDVGGPGEDKRTGYEPHTYEVPNYEIPSYGTGRPSGPPGPPARPPLPQRRPVVPGRPAIGPTGAPKPSDGKAGVAAPKLGPRPTPP